MKTLSKKSSVHSGHGRTFGMGHLEEEWEWGWGGWLCGYHGVSLRGQLGEGVGSD